MRYLTMPRTLDRMATDAGLTLDTFGDLYGLYDSDGELEEYGTERELWEYLGGL